MTTSILELVASMPVIKQNLKRYYHLFNLSENKSELVILWKLSYKKSTLFWILHVVTDKFNK